MAKDKKSFVAYADWMESFEELSDEEAGRLVKHLFRYVNDLEPEAPDKLTKMCFIPIKQSLKRDLRKYENYIEKQRENGKRGGRPKKPNKPNPFFENPTEPKKADSVSNSDSDSVSVNDSVSDKKKEGVKRFAPPTLQELNAYISTREIQIDAENFLDHYKSNGWMVGRNKMKDWKAAVRTWEKKEKSFAKKEKDNGRVNVTEWAEDARARVRALSHELNNQADS